jgi:hypothetical protein
VTVGILAGVRTVDSSQGLARIGGHLVLADAAPMSSKLDPSGDLAR